MKITGLILIILLFSGCSVQTLNRGLPYLVGEPLESAIDILGIPNGKTEIAGYTVYHWDSSSSFSLPTTQYNTSQMMGTIGTIPVSGFTTSTSTAFIPINHSCHIKIAVSVKAFRERLYDSRENIIQRTEVSGNDGGCERYRQRVQKLIPKGREAKRIAKEKQRLKILNAQMEE